MSFFKSTNAVIS